MQTEKEFYEVDFNGSGQIDRKMKGLMRAFGPHSKQPLHWFYY